MIFIRTKAKILVFSLLLILQSCVLNYNVNRVFDPISNTHINIKDRANNIEVYFDGEPINFEYDRVGIVNVRLSSAVDRSHLISHLKYEAWKNGANALIAVKIGDLSNVSGTKHITTSYIPVISGIAIRKLLKPEQASIVDTSFITVVKVDQKLEEKSKNDAITGTGCFVVLMISILVVPFILIFS